MQWIHRQQRILFFYDSQIHLEASLFGSPLVLAPCAQTFYLVPPEKCENPASDVNGEERQSRNYGRNTEFVQTATEQDESDVWDKFVVANGPEVSFSTTITGASGGSPQLNQVCNNAKRTKVSREMERAGRTSLTRRRQKR